MEKFWLSMDKFFSANKLFVGFCGALIVVWIALQVVMHLRIIEIAKLDAAKIFTWSWPVKNGVLSSSASNTCAQVIKKTGSEVTVKVTGKQALERHLFDIDADNNKYEVQAPPELGKRSLDCEATLTYYRSDNRWILGRVELK